MKRNHLSETLLLQFIFEEVSDLTLFDQIKEHLANCPECHEKFIKRKKVAWDLDHSALPPLSESFLPTVMRSLPAKPVPQISRFVWTIPLFCSILFFLAGLFFYPLLFRSGPPFLSEPKTNTTKTVFPPIPPEKELVSNPILEEKTPPSISPANVSIENLFIQLENRSPEENKEIKKRMQELFEHLQQEEFKTLLQRPESLSSSSQKTPEFQEEVWWWTHWSLEGKATFPFLSFANWLESTPYSISKSLLHLPSESRKTLYSAFPSFEFCIQIAEHFSPEVAPLLYEEWINLLASYYNPSQRDVFFRLLQRPQVPLKQWIYATLLKLDSQDPDLFESLIQYQLASSTDDLWADLQKHPRWPLLKEWLSIPEKQDLALSVYQKTGQAPDLMPLFELKLLSPNAEAGQHLAIQKIVETQDCTSTLIGLINEGSLDEQRRLSALTHLIRKEQQKTVAFLYTLCNTTYPGTLRKQALFHLEKFEGISALAQYSSASEDSDPMIRLIGTLLLLKHDRPSGIRLLRQQIQDSSDFVRQHARVALVHLEEPEIEEAMIQGLHENQPEENRNILRLLARRLQTPEAEQNQFLLLTKQLQKHRNIQEIPPYLAGFQQPELLPFLEKCCLSGYSPEVRESAIRSLSQIHSPRTVQILTSLIRTQKTEWGAMAIDSLALLAQQDPQILKQYFINYLDLSQPPALRLATASALKQTYQKEAIPLLLIALRDKRKEVTLAAQESLEYLSGQQWTREKEWQSWWNRNQDVNFEFLFLRKKQPVQALSMISIQKLLSDSPEQRNLAVKDLTPQWPLLLQARETTLLNEFRGSPENPVDILIQRKETLSKELRRDLLQLLTGYFWEEIQDYEWWWPILRAGKG